MKIQKEIVSFSTFLHMLRTTKPSRELKWTPEGFTNGQYLFPPDELKIVWVYRFVDELDADDVSILYIVKSDNGFVGFSQDVYGLRCSIGDACEDAQHVTDLLEMHGDHSFDIASPPLLPEINLNKINLTKMRYTDDGKNLKKADPDTNSIIHIQFGTTLGRAV